MISVVFIPSPRASLRDSPAGLGLSEQRDAIGRHLLAQSSEVSCHVRRLAGPARRTSAASAASAASIAIAGATTVRPAAAVRFYRFHAFLPRQIMQRYLDLVFPRKSADKLPHITFVAAQQLEDRLLAIEQDLDVEDFQRQCQVGGQFTSTLENPLAVLVHPCRRLLVLGAGKAQQLSDRGVGEMNGMTGRGRAEYGGKLQPAMAAHHGTIPSATSQWLDGIEPAEVAGAAVAQEVIVNVHPQSATPWQVVSGDRCFGNFHSRLTTHDSPLTTH